MDEADPGSLEYELRGLRVALARRQEAVANFLARIADVEKRIAEARGASASAGTAPARAYGAIRTAVIDIVRASPAGVASTEVGRLLRERFAGSVSPKTHLTTLKRLEAEGLAIRLAGLWVLTEEGLRAR